MSRRRLSIGVRVISAIALTLAATALPLAAQTRFRLEIEPGTEVRLIVRATPDRTARARVDYLSGDTLQLVPGDNIASRRLLLSDLARLEVRGGADRGRGIMIGAAIATAITGVAGGIDLAHNNISGGDLAGAIIGNAALGALLGYAFAPTGWERLPLPRR